MPVKKLLIVDDDPGVRDMIKEHFSLRGYEVFSADNVESGWNTAFRERPDLVLLDFNMPGHSGEELLKRVKQNLPGMKVVMVSARNEDAIKDRILNSGADAFLEKGAASISDVQHMVESLLRNKQGGDSEG